MNSERLKNDVREHYGRIAAEASPSCSSGCGCGTNDIDLLEGSPSVYAKRDAEIVEAADFGLGCGDPTRFSGLEEGMTVLDLGSGGGIDVFLAAKEVGPTGRSIGLDMTDEMLERAEENRQKLGINNVLFVRGEIESIPLPSNSVDRVISNCVINLVPDKQKAFREIHRVLKPGGSFVISDIVTEGKIPDKYRNDARLWAGCVAGAEDKHAYMETIRKEGFVDVAFVAENPVGNPEDLPFSIQSVTTTGRKLPQ